MRYVSVEDVLAISGEILGVDSANAVHSAKVTLAESAVARPASGFGGIEFYPTVAAKAAALLFGLARNHALLDGNKRTALLSTLLFLDQNGYVLTLPDADEALKQIVGVAAGDCSMDALAAWLSERLLKVSDIVAA